jgi:hypothetical protein
MAFELKKELRSVGLDEKWLQDRIKDDPSILGLGDLAILARERRQRGALHHINTGHRGSNPLATKACLTAGDVM